MTFLTLSDMTDTAWLLRKITFCDPRINQEHFPDNYIRPNLQLMSLTDLGLDAEDWYMTHQILSAMKKRGVVPAIMAELVHYAIEEWDQGRQVVALGNTWLSELTPRAVEGVLAYVPIHFAGTLDPLPRNQRSLHMIDVVAAIWTDHFYFLVVPSS